MRAVLARLRLLRDRLAERPGIAVALLAGVLLLAIVVSARMGALPLSVGEVVRAAFDADDPSHSVVWHVRLPRILAGVLVGAALAVAGALLQTVVRNPLADPSLIGVSAGAGLAAILVIVFLPEAGMALPFLAFAGALAAAICVLATSWGRAGPAGPLRLVLSGVALQSMLFGGIAAVTYLYADRAPAFVAFTVGSLDGCGWREVGIVALPTTIGIGLALLAVRPLNLMLLDDDTAMGVGLGIARARVAASCLAALLAAGAVSVAGLVGFIGLIVPNWVRLLTGPEHARLLVISCLAGAALLVVADALARTLAAPLELPVGALLAAVGGPYFLSLVWRRSL